MFDLLNVNQTNINFKNEIIDNHTANIFIYETFYHGGGVGIGDINNDGLQDIYFAGNQVNDKLYLNKGNLEFEDITEKAGIILDKSWSTGVSFVDINQDGLLDIHVSKSLYEDNQDLRRNVFYINNGDLTFTNKAKEYGLDDSNRTMNFFF